MRTSAGWRMSRKPSPPRCATTATCPASPACRRSAARAWGPGTSWACSGTARQPRSPRARSRELLSCIAATRASARTVNRHRAIVSAVFNYGMRESTFGLPSNPAKGADKRREPHPGPLVYYRVEEVEALARALADGLHRAAREYAIGEPERARGRIWLGVACPRVLTTSPGTCVVGRPDRLGGTIGGECAGRPVGRGRARTRKRRSGRGRAAGVWRGSERRASWRWSG